MDLTNRVTQLEDEIKVLKNEVLAVLLDVKESLLTRENPFTQQSNQSNADRPVININQSLPSYENAPQPENGSSASLERLAGQSLQTENAIPQHGNGNGNGNGHSHDSPQINGNGHLDAGRDDEPFQNHLSHQTPGNGNLQNHPSNGHGNERSTKHKFSTPMQTLWKNPENGSTGSSQISNSIEISTLLGLMKWVETTSAQIGPENTMTILDVTEMMGNIPEDLKLTLDKLVPHTEPGGLQEQVSSRTYLNCLKELARLLGHTNAGDFVAVHVVTHGLSAMTGGEKYG
jgi:hypothetical protein